MLVATSRLDVMNRLGRAMADPTRSRILLTLLDGPSYPTALAEDLDLSKQNVSNHLACLRDCGIVVTESEGRQVRYQIAYHDLSLAIRALLDAGLLIDDSEPCIDACCAGHGV